MAPPRLPQIGAMSPPPSPKHHTRRKSGQPHTTKSSKTSRPVLSRRQTTQSQVKSSKTSSPSHTEDIFDFDNSSESESFFNFCTSCDKQLSANSGNFLYCSERCRLSDLPSNTQKYQFPASPPLTPFAMTFPPLHERKRSSERDIIPRFSPSPYNDSALLSPDSRSAMDSLRSLSKALDASGRTPSSISLASRPASTSTATYALPRRASSDSESTEEEDDDSEEEEEYQRMHRRMPSTPHPGAALYGTYLKPSPKTYTSGTPLSGRPLPRKGTLETHKPRSVDLVTPVVL